ncbi:CAP domain-containing protein [Parapedobacter lycopersici]|uniref:CAP domain-containing protein n=1 Tax=Parapedobacter lycopersici TaxID=1864939 RepID=UPI00334027FB
MRYLVFVTAFWLLSSFSPSRTSRPTIDRREAREAFALINDIRQNPGAYQRKLHLSRGVSVSRTPLKWNNTLAKVAEMRALDMAKRDYFDHTDPDGFGPNYHIDRAGYSLNASWLKRKNANSFESIGANHPSAVEGINAMIIGRNSPGYAHRKHLLGIGEWNASLRDIGIGYVRAASGSTYKSYLCVIIAKHDW